MFSNSSKKPRHKVIDEAGNELDDTRPLGRLWFAAGLARHPRVEEPQRDERMAPSRILPVHGDRTIVMRVPSAPKPKPRPTVADRFPASFFEIPEFVEQIQAIQVRAHAVSFELMDRVNQRMGALVRRAREVSAAWRYENVGAQGYDMAAAYAAGGTEAVARMTPAVLAEMDRRRKQVAS